METIIPISELQSQAKKIVERVKNTRDTVIITQKGKPAALLVNYEDSVDPNFASTVALPANESAG